MPGTSSLPNKNQAKAGQANFTPACRADPLQWRANAALAILAPHLNIYNS